MRKHVAALIGTAALIGAAVPAVVATPASASSSIRCQPVGRHYVVTKDQAPIHKTPSPRGTVIGHAGKGHHVVSYYECDNSNGTWECISNCQVSDNGAPTLYGHWIYRGYLRQG
ncbi:hypothetical protein J2Z21_007993 [Streptomyces griseochromogenes]|uniref:SH3b domain-containing protein n=1 Tax=Streptomyces griseochromogenes TaxID=68214 RepID=A0A1B1B4I1_9ACTN|nr:hypothetical protein [Streptomyces griseochromogenes]ANP53724.1 hypothetical protein AVL59_32960 [Streptomyces griseochromogenes]MBP2054981.1 hypothetical protein [Streptomyces griseochromogenes]